jgi:hypothetical protein
MLNTTGRSMKIAWSRVIMKSCIMVPFGVVMGAECTRSPVASST